MLHSEHSDVEKKALVWICMNETAHEEFWKVEKKSAVSEPDHFALWQHCKHDLDAYC